MAQGELELLSAVKDDPSIIDDLGLSKDLFEVPCNRKLFQAMSDLRAQGVEAFDDIVLSHALTKYGVEYADAAVLIGRMPLVFQNSEYYHKQVLSSWRGRKIKKLGQAVAGGNTVSVEEHIAEIEKVLTEIKWDERKLSNLSDVLPEMISEIEKRFHAKESGAISSGWSSLDELLCGGFRQQELIIIGARTSIGKTTAALNLAYTAARAGDTVGFFSAEMSKTSLAERIASRVSGVDLGKMRTGKMAPTDFTSIMESGDELMSMKIIIDDTPNIKLGELWSKARKMKRLGARILFVDYLTLISYENHNLPRHERIGLISKQMKQIARELDVPIICMSQLNRETEKSGEPSLANIRQSGEIEEDADTIILLWRDAKDEHLGNGNLKAKVAKARNARTGQFGLYFDRSTMRIEERI